MGKLKGLASIVSELRVERSNLVNQLRHVDAALTVLGKLDGGISYTFPCDGHIVPCSMELSHDAPPTSIATHT